MAFEHKILRFHLHTNEKDRKHFSDVNTKDLKAVSTICKGDPGNHEA